MGVKDSLTVIVAREIRASLQPRAESRLPSVRRLAEEYDVSVRTIRNALTFLANEGDLVLSSRRRARIVSKATSCPRAAGRAEDRFYEELRGEIIGGTYPEGRELPKVAYFEAQWHLSTYIVRKVLRRLVLESLLHRRGNRIRVGPAPSAVLRRGSLSRGILLVCVPSPSTWESLRASRLTGSFCIAFCNEASRYGIRLREVVYADPRGGKGQRKTARTEQMSTEAIKAGSRYRGALVLGDEDSMHANSSNQAVADPVGNAVDTCLALGRPVVWLDRNDRAGGRCRKDNLFTRCRYDEQAVATTAAEYLLELGHRNTAFVKVIRNTDSLWQSNRAAALKDAFAAAPTKSNYSVWETHVGGSNPLWPFVMDERLRELRHSSENPRIIEAANWFIENRNRLLRRLRRCERPELRSSPYAGFFAYRQALLEGRKPSKDETKIAEYTGVLNSASAFFPMVSGAEHPSALIVPNYEILQWYVTKWLSHLEIGIPSSISLLTFDYVDPGVLGGVTTVDLGFGTLGYQAFHAITGLVRTDRNRMGEVGVRPIVVDRGTCIPVRSGN